jgi:hypothetical protein
MECPTCGAPARPDGPDAVINSSDGPLLLTRWRCSRSRSHWWHRTTDVSRICAQEAECESAEWLVSEIAVVLSRLYRSGYRPR